MSDATVELKTVNARMLGAQHLFQAKITEFSALCIMGSFREAADMRDVLHAQLDALLDAAGETFRATRSSIGL